MNKLLISLLAATGLSMGLAAQAQTMPTTPTTPSTATNNNTQNGMTSKDMDATSATMPKKHTYKKKASTTAASPSFDNPTTGPTPSSTATPSTSTSTMAPSPAPMNPSGNATGGKATSGVPTSNGMNGGK